MTRPGHRTRYGSAAFYPGPRAGAGTFRLQFFHAPRMMLVVHSKGLSVRTVTCGRRGSMLGSCGQHGGSQHAARAIARAEQSRPGSSRHQGGPTLGLGLGLGWGPGVRVGVEDWGEDWGWGWGPTSRPTSRPTHRPRAAHGRGTPDATGVPGAPSVAATPPRPGLTVGQPRPASAHRTARSSTGPLP